MFSICERRLCSFGPTISDLINIADELKNRADADWTCKADKEAMRASIKAIETAERILLERFNDVIHDKLKSLEPPQEEAEIYVNMRGG